MMTTPTQKPKKNIVTRFAPSPTGFLHLGGARTAFFNWLYARHHGGEFRLRIEDTDRARSTAEATEAIFSGLRWLGLDWDGAVVYQSRNADRHRAVAEQLLQSGHAYRCYATQEDLEQMRKEAQERKQPPRYNGLWRDRDPADAPQGAPYVVRIKAPQVGDMVLEDGVQGAVRLQCAQLDDYVLLRSDHSPTYMLSVVVDDHDMGITDIIRGDDHLTNAFRQKVLYEAMGWETPRFTHIPLIHGADGAKLSKRHGALGVEAYRDQEGILAEAMRNYLLRLGWSHGDEELISTEQAISWFSLGALGKSPARFDLDKLYHLNAHYLRQATFSTLKPDLQPYLEQVTETPPTPVTYDRIERGIRGLQERAKTLGDLAELALVYHNFDALAWDTKAREMLSEDARALLVRAREVLSALEPWSLEALEQALRAFAEAEGVKLGKVAMPLRIALSKRRVTPGIFELLYVLGKKESLERMNCVLQSK